jgi:response regulator RpfG family c-di-GMP phosphodiesterase
MLGDEVYLDPAQQIENTRGGKFLLIDDDCSALEACSSSLRREGHEVRAFASFSEGLSCLESEHFDLVMVKLRADSTLTDERFWTVESRFPAGGPACFWHAVSTGVVTWMWRTWDNWRN